ncbi:putative quinol monooxygenase [Streptomyces sp. NBC_00670]|jgi:quinol monooxygenase YgiN|uniref:putative quinol monooxygenase n=1 Tax=Streptomyces sp. NBC_00670 TaxID=2975804 RepID=UPI002E35FA51|nr:putative quinol monooxygenase [Streptomyces sp. NBC_00670]
MPYAVVAHYRCAPEDDAAVRVALREMRERTRGEPANLAYEVHAEAGVPGSFVLYELYVDRAGFDAHSAAPYFAELIVERVRPLLTERTVTFAEVV